MTDDDKRIAEIRERLSPSAFDGNFCDFSPAAHFLLARLDAMTERAETAERERDEARKALKTVAEIMAGANAIDHSSALAAIGEAREIIRQCAFGNTAPTESAKNGDGPPRCDVPGCPCGFVP